MAQVSNIHLIDSEKTNKSRNTNLQPNSKTQTESTMQAKKASVKKKTVSRPATGKLHQATLSYQQNPNKSAVQYQTLTRSKPAN